MPRIHLTGVTALAVALVLLGAACSGDDSSDSSDTPAAPPSTGIGDETAGIDDDPDAPEGFELEATSVTASLDQGTGTLVPAGSVTVSWYATDGNYAFVFSGADFSTIDDLCPGSSLETSTGFESPSNGPAVDGACEGYPTALAPIEPKVCGELLVAFSAIPLDGEGLLRGSLEAGPIDTIQSQSSSVESNGGDVPDIDADADAYVIDGTEYVCT